MAELTAHAADEALFLWVAGELDAHASSELEEHVRRCPECARRLEREAQLEVAMQQIGASRLHRGAHVAGPRPVAGLVQRLLGAAPSRTAFAAASVVLVAVLGVLGARSLSGRHPAALVNSPDRSHYPFRLDEVSSKDVYGYGDELGVTVQTRDEVSFQFEYSESIPVAYYVKVEASGVERRDQVEISLNGVTLGYLAAGVGDYAKAQRIKLPKKYLKAGGTNDLVFDATDNPPNAVPWALAKVKLLIKALPVCSEAECVAEAKKRYDLAADLLSKRDIAADNRFRAWSLLHTALLFLENVEPKPDLWTLSQATLRELSRELDGRCNTIMMTAKRFEELRDPRRALYEYKNGLAWFPEADDEHPCRARLRERIAEYGSDGGR